MNKLFLISCLFLCSCKQSSFIISTTSQQAYAPNSPLGTLIFVQSTDIIASRIAQDQFVRIWKYPAKQAYVFMNKSYIDSLSWPRYQSALLGQQIAYMLCIRIQENPEPNADSTFLEAYEKHFSKLMYHPVYTYTKPHAFVDFSVFEVASGALIWHAQSGQMPLKKLATYLQESYPHIQRALEKANYFSIK